MPQGKGEKMKKCLLDLIPEYMNCPDCHKYEFCELGQEICFEIEEDDVDE